MMLNETRDFTKGCFLCSFFHIIRKHLQMFVIPEHIRYNALSLYENCEFSVKTGVILIIFNLHIVKKHCIKTQKSWKNFEDKKCNNTSTVWLHFTMIMLSSNTQFQCNRKHLLLELRKIFHGKFLNKNQK